MCSMGGCGLMQKDDIRQFIDSGSSWERGCGLMQKDDIRQFFSE